MLYSTLTINITNIFLANNDSIFIPKNPYVLTVGGAVSTPTAVIYKKGADGKYKKDNSKTLKDYINLLGDIDGQIYRASEAQTIKGLADLSFRNIIVEQAATKLEGDDKQSLKAGAKFSRRRNFENPKIDKEVIEERRKFEKET